MNWYMIRIGIDILTVFMSLLILVVLYIAYKTYRKVTRPLEASGILGGLVDKGEKEDG